MKANTIKYIFFIMIVVLVVLGIYFLYKDGSNTVKAIESKKMIININEEINLGIIDFDTINPINSINKNVQYIDKLIYEPLIDIDVDFKLKNNLLEECSKINEKTYILKLNKNKYWHNKKIFSADDILYTINLIKENENSIYFNNVKDIKSINKIDEYTMKIELEKDIPFFEYLLSIPIMQKENDTIGTGDYKIANITEEKIILEAFNEDTKIKKININLYKNINEMYVDFSKNKIDIIVTDNIKYEDYLGTIGFEKVNIKNREYTYLAINNKKNDNKEIRKALKFLIDLNSLNYEIYNNKYNVSKFPIDYGSYLVKENLENFYNESKAKEILISQGYKYANNKYLNGGKQIEYKLLVNKDDEESIKIAEKIKEQLEDKGIKININQKGEIYYKSSLNNKNYELAICKDIMQITPNIKKYFDDENIFNYENKEVLEIIEKIKSIKDNKQLEEEYLKIQEIYNEEVPFISLLNSSNFLIISKRIKGNFNCNWYNVFYNIKSWYKILE